MRIRTSFEICARAIIKHAVVSGARFATLVIEQSGLQLVHHCTLMDAVR